MSFNDEFPQLSGYCPDTRNPFTRSYADAVAPPSDNVWRNIEMIPEFPANPTNRLDAGKFADLRKEYQKHVNEKGYNQTLIDSVESYRKWFAKVLDMHTHLDNLSNKTTKLVKNAFHTFRRLDKAGTAFDAHSIEHISISNRSAKMTQTEMRTFTHQLNKQLKQYPAQEVYDSAIIAFLTSQEALESLKRRVFSYEQCGIHATYFLLLACKNT
jgi:hypothetical protein